MSSKLEAATQEIYQTDQPRLICIIGPDGVGKSSLVNLLVHSARKKGCQARRVWLRFPCVFSAPLLLYCRIAGLSYYSERDGIYHGVWEFWRSRWVSTLFPWLQLIDTTLLLLFKVYLPLWLGQTIVCDRFVHDVLVDISSGTDQQELDTRLVGRLFLRLVPSAAHVICLDTSSDIVFERRPELVYDQAWRKRRDLYLLLSENAQIPLVNNSHTLDSSARQLCECLQTRREIPGKLAPIPGLRHLRNLAKERIYHSRWLSFLSHWTFQSILYMDWTERFFKVAFETVLFACLCLIMASHHNAWPRLILAFLVSHTINFLFNSHVTSALKRFGLCRRSTDELLGFALKLGAILSQEESILFAGIWGGFARGTHSEVPDLDIFAVRRTGIKHGLRASWQALEARTLSLAAAVPLDLYVLDSVNGLARLRCDETPIILCDRDGLLEHLYPMAAYLRDQYFEQSTGTKGSHAAEPSSPAFGHRDEAE